VAFLFVSIVPTLGFLTWSDVTSNQHFISAAASSCVCLCVYIYIYVWGKGYVRHPVAWRESQGRQRTAGQSRPWLAISKSTKRTAFCAKQPSAIRWHYWGFSRDFSSFVRQMPGYSMQNRGTALTPLPQVRGLHLSVWKTSQNSSLRQSQSGLRTQTTNQPKFIPPILSPGQPRP